MATKAERYRADEQRANQLNNQKTKHPPKASRTLRTEAVSRRTERVKPLARNHDNRSNNKGGSALEASASGRPSRKSTRGSSGHVKLNTNLTRRTRRRATSPGQRAAKAQARVR
jgi:hypothetical protein